MIARDPRDVELDRAVLAASLAESIDPAMLLSGFGIVDAIHREETQDFVVAVAPSRPPGAACPRRCATG